ncbi:MAG: protease complex subunit PrcB family protein [Clostridiales bacterium]|nr:protease complex subunit PrcB family protein [Clostridiales bacterium]
MKQYKKVLLTGIAALMAVSFILTGCDKGKSGRPSLEDTDLDGTKQEENPENKADDADSDDTVQAGGAQDMAPGDPLEEEGTIGDISYRISASSVEGTVETAGFDIFSEEQDIYRFAVIINAGEKSTGGYEINITDIAYDGSEMIITVEETSPGPDEMVTEALTYPSCAVELDKLPKSVKVVWTNGTGLPCDYIYIDDYELPEGWLAVLKDGAGEIMYETYVYETSDGKYEYINIRSTTVSWGAAEWNDIVCGSGAADTREDVVSAAEEFGSAGFVMFNNDSATYSIDEFLAAKAG